MRVILAGSRSFRDPKVMADAVSASGFDVTSVLSGTARGADRLGENWAFVNNVPMARYPADWNRHGKSAGVLRNKEMAENADALIALWDGESRGTAHMIKHALARGLAVYVHDSEVAPDPT